MKRLLIFALLTAFSFALAGWENTDCYDSVEWGGYHYVAPKFVNSSYSITNNIDYKNPIYISKPLNCTTNQWLGIFDYYIAGGAAEMFSTTNNLFPFTSGKFLKNFNNVTLNYSYDFSVERNLTINDINIYYIDYGLNFSNGTDSFYLFDNTPELGNRVAFYTNKTMCMYNSTNALMSCLSVPTGAYSVRWSLNYAPASSSANFNWTNDGIWFMNSSINKRTDNNLYIYFDTDASPPNNRFTSQTNKFPIKDYSDGSEWNFIGWNTGSTGNLTPNNKWFLTTAGNSSGQIGTVTNPYTAIIISPSSTIITPKWTFYNINLYGNNFTAAYKNYDVDTNAVPLISNVIAYIVGEDGLCYYVPPYTPTNLSLIYTISAYYHVCGATTHYINIPKLPYLQLCNENNGIYAIRMNLTESADFLTTITYTNATVVFDNATGSSYSFDINTTEVAQINHTINGRQFCAWDNRTSWFDIPKFVYPDGQENNTNKLLGLPLMMGAIGLSTITPFAFTMVFVINDYFGITSMNNIALLGIMVAVITSVAGWWGERNLKTLLIFVIISAAMLGGIILNSTVTGVSTWSSYTTTLGDDIEELRVKFDNNNFDLLAIAQALPTFFVDLLGFILNIPSFLFNMLLELLMGVNPIIGSKFSTFNTMINVIAWVFIALKGYEIVKNTFRSI